MEITVISGFLGSGKTTLIKEYLNRTEKNKRIVILENDFGSVNFDSNALNGLGAQIQSFENGCICCSLSSDLQKTLKETVKQYKPDQIIIEPSGVVLLSQLLRSLQDIETTEDIVISNVICVIDANKYEVYLHNFENFYVDQIENSNYIFLTHTDMMELSRIEEIQSLIERSYNKEVIIINDDTLENIDSYICNAKYIPHQYLGENHNIDLMTKEIVFERSVVEKQFQMFIEWITNKYEIVRMKGTVVLNNEPREIQYTLSKLTIIKSNNSLNRLTVIGKQIPDDLDEIVDSYFKQNQQNRLINQYTNNKRNSITSIFKKKN